MDPTGEPFFVPLERIKTESRGRPGRFRFYNVYRLPCEYAGEELRLRLTGNDEDASRGLNRSEHLRAIPPADADSKVLMRLRTIGWFAQWTVGISAASGARGARPGPGQRATASGIRPSGVP